MHALIKEASQVGYDLSMQYSMSCSLQFNCGMYALSAPVDKWERTLEGCDELVSKLITMYQGR